MFPAQYMFLFFGAVILSGAWIVVTARNLIYAASWEVTARITGEMLRLYNSITELKDGSPINHCRCRWRS